MNPDELRAYADSYRTGKPFSLERETKLLEQLSVDQRRTLIQCAAALSGPDMANVLDMWALSIEHGNQARAQQR